MTTDSIEAAQRLATVREAMARTARLNGRAAADITLIAVSKTQDAAAIRPLIAAGQRVFGENRVQEAQGKWPALREETPDIALHLVGQLQSNKAAEAVALFNVIHSLDRPSLLNALAKAMDAADKRLPCFIQVNIGAEEQKGGCPIADTPALIRAARDADIPVAGLMCVPPADVEPAPYFALLAKMAREEGLQRLSMGMSGDYETAIMLGATDIRVGTALFGERPSAARPVPASGRGMIRNSRAK
ncbi:MAG TPA: YggS family pyridoxal phosphate-dependent enzyme [Sphingobium sp.]